VIPQLVAREGYLPGEACIGPAFRLRGSVEVSVCLTYVAQACSAVRDVHAAYVSSRHTYCDGWCQSELPYVNACRCRVVVAC
jgi:hypothetical protein